MHASERRILNYWLVEELGHDRLGRVFRAEEARADRTVVLRLLRVSGVAPPDRVEVTRAALRRRIRAAAAVVHPSLAGVLDYSAHEDLEVLALEDVRGPRLSDLAARGELLPLDEVLRHATQIAAGLEAAHSKKVTHGRISPGNIRLGRDGCARLLDLGIPRPTEIAYHLAGVADGDVLDTERRRDVHALARTIQFMVTGDSEPAAIKEARSMPGLGGAIVSGVSGVIESRDASVARLREALVEIGRMTPADAYVVERPSAAPAAWRPRSRPSAVPPARPAPATAPPHAGDRAVPDRARVPSPDHGMPSEPARTPGVIAPAVGSNRPDRADEPPRPLSEVPLLVPEPRPYRRSLGPRLIGAARANGQALAAGWARLRRPLLQFAGSAAAGAVLVLATLAIVQRAGGGDSASTVAPASELAAQAEDPTAPDRDGALPGEDPDGAAAAFATPPAPAPAPPPIAEPAATPASMATPPARDVGELRVSVVPRGALVSLDDGPWRPAPVSFIELPAGQHRVRIRRDGFAERSVTVIVRAGETTRQTIDLTSTR